MLTSAQHHHFCSYFVLPTLAAEKICAPLVLCGVLDGQWGVKLPTSSQEG